MDADRLFELEQRHEAVLARLADPAVLADQRALTETAREQKSLELLLSAFRRRIAILADLATAREMLASAGDSERGLAKDQIAEVEAELATIESLIAELTSPRDPYDGRNVIMEIRGAEGGEEANLFARDLMTMYQRYAERRGWKVEVLSSVFSDQGGANEVVLRVAGADCWRRLKHEAGPHRVQRVPVTESQGRVHTSSATVVVLPEADEVEVRIDPADLRVDVFRSTGPGGQSVNTTDSAVRVTHLPTGITVSMQDEKSQIQNRAKAMAVLRSRLLDAEKHRQAQEQASQRRTQVGGGGRSEKVRTYNFKENRVTDHRAKVTLHNLDRFLNGELDGVVDALVEKERMSGLGGEPAV
jgi:peptide chain release factor 1